MMNEPNGILVINKPSGITSHDVVNRIRRLYSTKRVGHTGTLDPMATGVLVVLIGRAAKASEYAVSSQKSYRATFKLGITTDTEDITGTVLTECIDFSFTEEDVALATRNFLGNIMQTPPMYSALKRDGKKLCDLAREGKVIERTPRPITIHSISVERIDDKNYTLTTECSSGTYIRTLCADIGASLGVGAAMTSLCRTEACGFKIENAVDLDSISDMNGAERLALLHPTEELFSSLCDVTLPAFYERLFRSGCEIYLSKAKLKSFDIGTRLRILDSNGDFFALGEVRDYPDGRAIKSIKLFSL